LTSFRFKKGLRITLCLDGGFAKRGKLSELLELPRLQFAHLTASPIVLLTVAGVDVFFVKDEWLIDKKDESYGQYKTKDLRLEGATLSTVLSLLRHPFSHLTRDGVNVHVRYMSLFLPRKPIFACLKIKHDLLSDLEELNPCFAGKGLNDPPLAKEQAVGNTGLVPAHRKWFEDVRSPRLHMIVC
jgi:hypothetical protein